MFSRATTQVPLGLGALVVTIAGGVSQAADSLESQLTALSPCWNRISDTDSTVDPGCAAVAADSYNDGVPYVVFEIQATQSEPLDLIVTPLVPEGILLDPFVALYCAPPDANDPAANLVAADDDGRGGPNAGFDAGDGVVLDALTPYFLVVTSYGSFDGVKFGTFRVDLGGSAVFAGPGACCLPDGTCADAVAQADCAAQGGEYRGSSTTCASDPCRRTRTFATDANALDLTPFDDAYDGTLETMASLTLGDCDCLTITDVDVVLDIAHTWTGDLTIKLRSPGGTVVDLVSRPGFAEPADDGSGCCGVESDLIFGNTYEIDDAAGASSEDMGIGEDTIAPFVLHSSGFANAFGLTTLNAERSAGDWTLYVGDSAAQDNGTFDGFSLQITGYRCFCDPANGDVTGDGCVSFSDILEVLGNWNNAGGPGIPGDANCDGAVTFADILVILGTWGQGCK